MSSNIPWKEISSFKNEYNFKWALMTRDLKDIDDCLIIFTSEFQESYDRFCNYDDLNVVLWRNSTEQLERIGRKW